MTGPIPEGSSPVDAPRSGWEAYKTARSQLLPMYPELTLHLFATRHGMRILAQLYHAGPMGLRLIETIADAVWQPSAVTERKVVEWGERALRAWLEQRLADLPDAD